jgi:hypothetical protein
LEIGKVYNGFRLLEVKPINEMNATAHLFSHEKSGARLLFMETEDDNKVFSITFRTPPLDNMGTAHIVEHSTLCGSRKFPLREPFVELVKGSLNTYLNAMTFSDKTMYPVASRNAKDFRNLMDVYLDAVFYPSMYECEEILMQEGWHYELDSKEGELTYKGVVYNEMKGALSAPEAMLDREIMASLYPDSIYGYESGGDPDAITDLTQERFLDFHKKYYHPSNSYIYLYGDLDMMDNLAFLDREYLSAFTKKEIDSAIKEQPLFKEKREFVKKYPISTTETTAEKTFLSWNAIIGRADEAEAMLAMQILEYSLLRTPGAPLKKALIDAGIGKDILSALGDDTLQPSFSIIASGSEEERLPLFERTIRETLTRLAEDGIDKRLIEGSINLLEFRLREANFGSSPKGLVYNIRILDSWLYDLPIEMYVAYEELLTNIKAGFKDGYFERLIKERLLQSRHVTTVVLKPERGLSEARDKEIAAELAAYKASLSDAEIENIISMTQKLREHQITPDSPEALATIPLLKLSDINPAAEKLIFEERQFKNSTVLLHDLPTNKIAYWNMMFDLRYVPQEDIPYLYLMAELLGKIDTNKHSYGELSTDINLYTGGMSFDVGSLTDAKDAEKFYPFFKVRSKCLVSRLEELGALFAEILTESLYSDRQRIKEIIDELGALLKMYMLRNAQQVAASRVGSYFSEAGAFSEMGFLSFYDFIVDLEKHFDEKIAAVSERLAEVSRKIFNANNLLVSITLEKKYYGEFEKSFGAFYSSLPSEEYPKQTYKFKTEKLNEGLMTSSKVQYVVKGANFRKLGFSYTGRLRVIETILRYDYFWSKIRVQGGAYGAYTQFKRNGSMAFGSYRDPNLAETVEAFDGTGEYLRSFDVDEREMTKYIIGTISGLDVPRTPQMQGDAATECFIRHIAQADLQKERDEILVTTQDDIRALGDLIDACMKENYLCVLGSEEKIKASREFFGSIKNIFA